MPSPGPAAAPVPDAAEMRRRYTRAERFLPWNAARLTTAMGIEPRWDEDGATFWYRVGRDDGTHYVRVDPAAGTVAPAFDHPRVAAALSRETGTSHDPASLDLDELSFAGDDVAFRSGDAAWSWDGESGTLSRRDAPAPPSADAVRSPDGQWDVFVREHDLRLRRVADGTETRLTTDGEAGHGYGTPLTSPLATAGIADPEGPVAHWSPDSRRFLSCRIDERPARRLHLVQSVPLDGSTRPRLHTYAYPLPGDDDADRPQATGWLFSVPTGDVGATATAVAMPPLPMAYYGAPFGDSTLWWAPNGQRLFLLTRARGGRSYALHAIDAMTGVTRVIRTETTRQGIDPYLFWADVNIRPIGDGREVIWYDQRDGWGHLSLVDGATGETIRSLTRGPYQVARLAHVHEGERWVAFTALGREPGVDPYHNQLYRLSLDGAPGDGPFDGATRLTSGDGDHTVRYSPDGAWFVDIVSDTTTPPVTTLHDASGSRIATLERAGISTLLATGWTPPERFHARARDGVTEVYGVVIRPTGYDPVGSYPVIDYIYGGPQTTIAPTTFTDATPFTDPFRNGRGSGFWQAQAIAELGFVVVMIDGLGMPGRSRAFHDRSYRDLADSGIPDHIAAIRQLGDRDPALDTGRVGIYGHSAGGYASARAILDHGDFYSVCVSSAGNHDHRTDKASWVERYMSPEVGEHYDAQANRTIAHQLTGRLLLVHGEMDENVHPSATLALADALIRANRDFDLLIIPNRPHRLDDDPYFLRRRWDYFVRHLLDAEPPAGYRIAAPPSP